MRGVAKIFVYLPGGNVRRFTYLVVIALALGTGTPQTAALARASPLPTIPIQIINTNAGRVMTAGAQRYEDKVYISGLVYRPPSPGIGAHVHVWGVDNKNRTVFFKTTYVAAGGKFNRTESYVVSVSPETFKKAMKVFVTFHSQSDAESRTEDTQ